MIALNSLPDLFALLSSHSHFVTYLILFLLMFFEGPIVTYVAAFAASLGYLDIRIILVLGVLGNQIPDVILYFIGRSLKRKTVEKILSFAGLNKDKLGWLRRSIKKHYKKSLLSFKVIPNLPIPGLILTGFTKLEFKKFFWATFIMNIVLAIVFVGLGFYSGIAVSSFLKSLKLLEYLIPIVIILAILLYFVIKALYSKISERLNRKDE